MRDYKPALVRTLAACAQEPVWYGAQGFDNQHAAASKRRTSGYAGSTRQAPDLYRGGARLPECQAQCRGSGARRQDVVQDRDVHACQATVDCKRRVQVAAACNCIELRLHGGIFTAHTQVVMGETQPQAPGNRPRELQRLNEATFAQMCGV